MVGAFAAAPDRADLAGSRGFSRRRGDAPLALAGERAGEGRVEAQPAQLLFHLEEAVAGIQRAQIVVQLADDRPPARANVAASSFAESAVAR